ncbi:MAG: hypothetical protein HY832_03015 [Candidatus Aenigmarchaeota archaeon]|nr:hypothetical protein [Candidatus Aenigmarchaeota archaeon]
MKGVIQILEAITASIILLAALIFFFEPRVVTTDWDQATLQLQLQDLLATQTQTIPFQEAVLNRNAEQLRSLFSSFTPFSTSIAYAVRINGIPNPKINIGCLCLGLDAQKLRTTLGNKVTYHGRDITFSVTNISIGQINDYDIVYFFDPNTLFTNKRTIESFVQQGGSVVLQSDLDQAKAISVQSIFNFTSLGTPPSSQYQALFYNPDVIGVESYKLQKYYKNISDEGAVLTFGGFGSSPVFLDQNSKTLLISSDRAVVYLNSMGRGRALWFDASSMSSSGPLATLLRSAVLLASEGYAMDNTRVPDGISLARVSALSVTKNLEVFETEITAWRVFS